MSSIHLAEGWKFYLDESKDAQHHAYWYKEYDDSEWEKVRVPHDWSIHYPFSKEYSSGTGYVKGGIGWYRLHFTLPQELENKKIWIVFDGVYKNAQVWCNSYYQGKRAFGYATFKYDISSQLRFGEEENVIAVQVSHTDVADSRWFTGSGIYRKVYLIVQEETYIEPDSLFFNPYQVEKEQAKIKCSMKVGSLKNEEVSVQSKLMDAQGTIVLTMSKCVKVKEGSLQEIEMEETLENPCLWSDENPYLYTLETSLTNKEGEYKADRRKVGVRKVLFDPDKGFLINGEPKKLKGVCLHHDAGCLGAAVTKEVWQRRLIKLKEMGCNAIRGSHNPHMPELYELCDALGFYMIDEAFDEWEGPKNKWSTGHNVYPPKHEGYYLDFPQCHEEDLKGMIMRDRNHPSVILWSIGNEIDYPNDPYCHPLFQTMTGNNDANKPAKERMYHKDKPNAERLSVLAKNLAEIVKKTDQSRPVTIAAAYPELSTKIGFIDAIDVVGYNYKEEFYEQDHQRFPKKPFLGSENGHDYKAWRAVTDNEYIAGQFLWTGIDYLGEAYGWPIRGSGAGLMTLAGFEKSRYYYRKSLWTDTPMVKVMTTSERQISMYSDLMELWNYPADMPITVHIYTNQKQVRIYLNGEKLGEYSFDEEKGYIQCEVPFKAGVLSVEGVNEQGEVTCIDEIKTTGAPCALQVKAWKLPNKEEGLWQIQGEIQQIEVAVVDAGGIRVANATPKIKVEIEGEGILLGLESGDLADTTEYTLSSRHAYEGRLIIYIQKQKGEEKVKLRISAKGYVGKEFVC